MVGTVLLILDVGVGRRAGLVGAAGIFSLVVLAASLPLCYRHIHGVGRGEGPPSGQ